MANIFVNSPSTHRAGAGGERVGSRRRRPMMTRGRGGCLMPRGPRIPAVVGLGVHSIDLRLTFGHWLGSTQETQVMRGIRALGLALLEVVIGCVLDVDLGPAVL